ncbi:MAG: T9SS type A sorting domain-containing protein [Bacteroidetes bacterium]|nr:T9SS type A sorting domain-containing protein [Bacteroidota bacterium]
MKKSLLFAIALILSVGISSAQFVKQEVSDLNAGLDNDLFLFDNQTRGVDTLSNITPLDTPTVYLAGTWGFLAGHNSYNFTDLADKYTGTAAIQVTGMVSIFYKAYSGSGTSAVNFQIWTDGATPGASLGSKSVLISTLIPMSLSSVTFTSPIPVTGGSFFAGMSISYANPDTVAAVQAKDRSAWTTGPTEVNTAYAKYAGAWSSITTLFGGMKTSFDFLPIVSTASGQEEILTDRLLVFPNPSNGILNIANGSMIESIRLINPIGQIVFDEDVQTKYYKMSTENFQTGVYFLQVVSGSETFTQRVILK